MSKFDKNYFFWIFTIFASYLTGFDLFNMTYFPQISLIASLDICPQDLLKGTTLSNIIYELLNAQLFSRNTFPLVLLTVKVWWRILGSSGMKHLFKKISNLKKSTKIWYLRRSLFPGKIKIRSSHLNFPNKISTAAVTHFITRHISFSLFRFCQNAKT